MESPLEFTRKAWGRVVYRFSERKQDSAFVAKALDEMLELKLPGEFRVIIPGNGGITSTEFRSSEVPASVDDEL